MDKILTSVMTGMSSCRHCGALVANGASECPHCGELAFVQKMEIDMTHTSATCKNCVNVRISKHSITGRLYYRCHLDDKKQSPAWTCGKHEKIEDELK